MALKGATANDKLRQFELAHPHPRVFPPVEIVNVDAPLWDKRQGNSLLWLLLIAAGLGLLLINPIFYATFTYDVAFAGLLLLTTASIGFSTHLSYYLQKPQYDVLDKIRNIIPDYKTTIGLAALSVLMLNPWATLLLTGLGLGMNLTMPDELTNLEQALKRAHDFVLAAIRTERMETYLPQLWAFMREHPGRTMSVITGSMLGFSLSIWSLTLLASPLFAMGGAVSSLLVDSVGESLLAIQGGVIPYLLLGGTAVGFQALLFAAPLVLITGSTTYGSYQLWEKTREFTLPLIQRTIEKTQELKQATGRQITDTNTYICERTATYVPNYFRKAAPQQPAATPADPNPNPAPERRRSQPLLTRNQQSLSSGDK